MNHSAESYTVLVTTVRAGPRLNTKSCPDKNFRSRVGHPIVVRLGLPIGTFFFSPFGNPKM
jgi:hypothetical protein